MILSRLQNAGQTGEFTIARRPFNNQQVLEPVSSTRQRRFTGAAIQIDRGIDSPHASTRNGSSFSRPIANRIAQASPSLSALAASAPPPELAPTHVIGPARTFWEGGKIDASALVWRLKFLGIRLM
jgi:hypothetical protein